MQQWKKILLTDELHLSQFKGLVHKGYSCLYKLLGDKTSRKAMTQEIVWHKIFFEFSISMKLIRVIKICLRG
jgi:hypothetical protein